MMTKIEKYERIFFTRTGFGLKKEHYKEVIDKMKKLANAEAEEKRKKNKGNNNPPISR